MTRIPAPAFRGIFAALVTVFLVALAAPAHASEKKSYSDVDIDIRGGNAAAFSVCVNYAQKMAKHDLKPQSNKCENIATAAGGEVEIVKTNVVVKQKSDPKKTTHNNVDLNISGGDAVAVAACVNYLQGTATAGQKVECANDSIAIGGNVVLDHVNLVVTQQ